MDFDAPNTSVLQRIHSKTVKPKTPVLRIVWRRVAAACLLTGISIGVITFIKKPAEKIAAITSTNLNSSFMAYTETTLPIKKDTIKNIVYPKQKTEKNLAGNNKKPEKSTPIDPYELLNSFEHNYSQLAKLQLRAIRNTPVLRETQNYFSDFKKTLKQMDLDESAIRKNIKENGLSNVLLEQLINIYQEKIALLKTLQNEINEMNEKIKQNHTSADSIAPNFINI